MLDLAEILPIIVITILTVLLTIVGFHLILVLKDLRHTLQRVNHILDQSESILHKFSHPTQSLGSLVGGIREGLKMVDTVSHLLSNRGSKSQSPYDPDTF